MSKVYPLDISNVGEDTYILISKGHHDVHEFMRKVREDGYDWPLGMPEHIHMKTIPAPKGSGYLRWSLPVPEGTRGSWPCTYVTEAYNEERYEVRASAAKESDHA